jgi:16S rRNA processing protein RimM
MPDDVPDDGALPIGSQPASAPSERAAPDAFLIVARVLRAHGVAGELACEIVTEFPERFKRTRRVFLSPPDLERGEPSASVAPTPMAVTRARIAPHRGHDEVIVQLDGVGDRDAAEKLQGWFVQVPQSEAWRLPRGRYYWHQIVGLRVVTTEGEEIGTVAEILETGANDVYVVKGNGVTGDGRERLIPAVKQVVTKIDPDQGEMVVALLPGM